MIKIKALFDGLDDGTIVVKKAECDANGNIISATYALNTTVNQNSSDIDNLQGSHGNCLKVILNILKMALPLLKKH